MGVRRRAAARTLSFVGEGALPPGRRCLRWEHTVPDDEATEMIRRLEQSHDNVVGYSLSGDVTDDEYTQMASELRDDLARFGTIRLLFRLSDLSLSAFFAALDERLRFVNEHQDEIERVAVVTDDKAAGVLSKAAESLGRIDIETFPQEDEPKAWAWLE